MSTTLVVVGLGNFKPDRDLIPDHCDHVGVFPPNWEQAILLDTFTAFQSRAHYHDDCVACFGVFPSKLDMSFI